ncbi:hypothetical protein EVAR_43631_1 [Eumeta japonica]|uniref:Uncharacterized protein n=1 Tax=Eumeta variegata TaxID=151549 RepID=A0A4C1XEU5_EUMVA|nr:hypothetical protein EVAR_43631_1 [Eumeta japonica]
MPRRRAGSGFARPGRESIWDGIYRVIRNTGRNRMLINDSAQTHPERAVPWRIPDRVHMVRTHGTKKTNRRKYPPAGGFGYLVRDGPAFHWG